MKADGIKIYTITFKVTQEETQDLLLKCATEPGFFYRADDNNALVDDVEEVEQKCALRVKVLKGRISGPQHRFNSP